MHQSPKSANSIIVPMSVVLALSLSATSLRADDWVIHATCDNQFQIYFGTRTQTTFVAGEGGSWGTTYTFNAAGRLATDYVYVASASDQTQAQGFIGDFANTTDGRFVVTGVSGWQVYAAGEYEATNPFWPGGWPASLRPTQAQVDTAIAYATANNLWRAPDTDAPGVLNGASPWGFRPGISADAQWIWHRAAGGPPSALFGSYNHDEFLVFRISGTRTCAADLDDDGSLPQNPDGGVTVDDLIFFLTMFEAGSQLVDLDNDGMLPQAPDGGVTIDDLLYFLTDRKSVV